MSPLPNFTASPPTLQIYILSHYMQAGDSLQNWTYIWINFMVNTNLVVFTSAIICHCQLLKTLKLRISLHGHYDDSAPQSEEDIILHHLTTLSLAVPHQLVS
ncbi:hypothetical protein BDQ17DRAFT_1287996 [Cyathus striatus]|nr:hypothetical protein BDQ17DRAFT_1287996 [Cyathus striatus]